MNLCLKLMANISPWFLRLMYWYCGFVSCLAQQVA